MFKNWKIISIIMALVLALTLGVTALAETAEAPAAEPPAAEPAAETPNGTDTALQEALDALAAARSGSRLTSLEEELKAYVEAGKLTQEQADLILKAYQDQESLRSGVCPNCGYQFSDSGFGKGGRTKNGSMNGFGGMKGFGGNGGRFGQTQNGTQQNTAPAPAEGPEGSGI